jgi:antitoxin (DNA-binding transcriptional repressor) of toxin-antitoxin stability system
MSTVTIEEAQSMLPQLIDKLAAGEAVIITRDQAPVAQLIPPPLDAPQPIFGSCKGKLIILAEDDDHLADFKEYMP